MAGIGRLEAAIDNARGRAPVLLTCEHASNFMPPEFLGLGLTPAQLADHVAWDIGAHALARRMAKIMDCAVIAAPASRLLVDPNRDIGARDLIPEQAEGAPVPGNAGLRAEDRAARIAAFHAPFHEAIEAHLAASPHVEALVAVHSFTPVLFGKKRPWHAGMLHSEDSRLADVMLAKLAREADINVGRNEPYAPSQGVYYTMDRHSGDRHAGARATVMIEVRNDLIQDEIGQTRWARLLSDALKAAMAALTSTQSRENLAQIGGRN